LLAQLASSGLAPKSRRKVVGVLSKALADAQRWHYVTHNAVAGAELPRPTRAAARAWSADQLSAFLAHVEGDRLYPLWRFLVATGCRRGEAVGLRWSDLDLEAGTALIANQRSIAGGSVVEGAPKTAAGARTVALDPETVAVLARWRRDQREEFLAAGVRPERGYVFTGREGGPLWPQGVTDRMAAITRQLGHPPIGVHGLRHSAATWMMGAGVSPKVVQQRLGHANVSVTLGIYSHVMPRRGRGGGVRGGPQRGARMSVEDVPLSCLTQLQWPRQRVLPKNARADGATAVPRRIPWSQKVPSTRVFTSAPPGIRTQNLRIKSPLLCR